MDLSAQLESVQTSLATAVVYVSVPARTESTAKPVQMTKNWRDSTHLARPSVHDSLAHTHSCPYSHMAYTGVVSHMGALHSEVCTPVLMLLLLHAITAPNALWIHACPRNLLLMLNIDPTANQAKPQRATMQRKALTTHPSIVRSKHASQQGCHMLGRPSVAGPVFAGVFGLQTGVQKIHFFRCLP